MGCFFFSLLGSIGVTHRTIQYPISNQSREQILPPVVTMPRTELSFKEGNSHSLHAAEKCWHPAPFILMANRPPLRPSVFHETDRPHPGHLLKITLGTKK